MRKEVDFFFLKRKETEKTRMFRVKKRSIRGKGRRDVRSNVRCKMKRKADKMEKEEKEGAQ